MEQVLSVYESIYAEYRKLIEKGVYRYGEQLPSVRSEAISRGVNPNTVLRAYRRLEEEAYIQAVPKKGIYVCYKATKGDRFLFLKEEVRKILRQGYDLKDLEEALSELRREEHAAD